MNEPLSNLNSDGNNKVLNVPISENQKQEVVWRKIFMLILKIKNHIISTLTD